MNTPNPLVPQGTTPVPGKSTFFFKVLMIVTVHVVLIGGMLLQGCSDTNKTTSSTPPPDTTAATTDTLPPLNPGISNAATSTAPNPAPGAPSNPAPVAQQTQATQAPPPMQPLPPATVPQTAPATTSDMGAKDYVIASGDTLGAIAHKNGISLKALLEANSGVNPKKLQIGQKIQIPAGTGSAGAGATAASAPGAAADMASSSGEAGAVYMVKPGDTLSKIAKQNHTSVKKIMALNELKTTSIKVSQKLKLPAPKTAGAETTPSSAAVVPLQAPPATTAPTPPPSTPASNQ